MQGGERKATLLFCRNIYTPWVFSPTPARWFPKGNGGKRVSSGYNRRRRLATRSSGKQQAERTAVRTAPIVCPEESPQCARRRIPLPPAGIDAPTPARGQGLQPYGALTLFFRWRKKSVQKKASCTATLAARPASHCGQALRYACAWLRASWPSAISGASRPSASLGGGLWSAVAPSGLSSTSVRFAHPSGEKALYCPF